MPLTFQKENYDDFRLELMDLVIDHWQDVALNKDTVPLNPNWETYGALCDQGVAHVLTARTEEGKLVGYSVCLMGPHLRYKDEKWAEGDVFFLHPEHRRGLAGLKMMKAVEEMMKTLGATKIVQKVKLHRDVGKIFERLGYNAIERVYVKDLI